MNDYRRLLGRLLTVTGCLLMTAVLTVNVVDYVRSRMAVSQFAKEKERVIVVNTEDVAAASAAVNQSGVKDKEGQIGAQDIDLSQTMSETQKALENGEVLGVLRISKINLEEGIREGSSSSVISSALGHMEETALPGQIGNCAIAGHRNYVFGRFFNRLDEIEPGDTVEIETLDGTFTYEVTDSFVVEPEDVSVLSRDLDQSELTLITCTPLFVGSHRLIIRGVLQIE